MKDQKALLLKCMKNDIPAVVISAKDINSVPTLIRYLDVAKQNNCDTNFIEDFSLVINAFIQYQKEKPSSLEKPNI